ncbi:FAS1 domain-containing protein [Bisporella sp. PMI_857]|nr:FAS1 domain-containing protein [Bisporella sp. PMI_857]
MDIVFFLILLLVRHVWCIPLLDLLDRIEELSTLNFHINASTRLTTLLSTADNFTFLAPSNSAFDEWLGSSGADLTEADIEETLTYHLLRGGFPTLETSSTPKFASSNLRNGQSANVTGGQVVEAVSLNNTPVFISGFSTVSNIISADILCTGGIIHIVGKVLEIPVSVPTTSQAAGLKVFVSIIEKGGFLKSSSTGVVLNILASPDVTTFIPNSMAALAAFNNITATNPTADRLNGIFNYHFVTGFRGYSSNLSNGLRLKSFQGSTLTITKRGNETFVNGAKITTSDMLVSNGVVHVIDGLLDPSNITTPLPLTSNSSSSDNSLSEAALGAIITFAVLIPIGIGIFAFWFFFRQRRRRAALAAPVTRKDPYARQFDVKGSIGSRSDNQEFELDTPISMRKSDLPFSVRSEAMKKKSAVFELDATSIKHGVNKALPKIR